MLQKEHIIKKYFFGDIRPPVDIPNKKIKKNGKSVTFRFPSPRDLDYHLNADSFHWKYWEKMYFFRSSAFSWYIVYNKQSHTHKPKYIENIYKTHQMARKHFLCIDRFIQYIIYLYFYIFRVYVCVSFFLSFLHKTKLFSIKTTCIQVVI